MSVTGQFDSGGHPKEAEASPPMGTTKPGLGKAEAPNSRELETQEALSPPPSDDVSEVVADAGSTGIADAAPAKPRKLSDAQRAIVAERTAAILKKARPGSKEYADACVERAEAGLAVPVMKKTAVDMLVLEQYQETHGDEIRKATRVPRYGVWAGVTLGIISVGTIAYVFLGPPSVPSRSLASTAATAQPAQTAQPKSTASVEVPPVPPPAVTPVAAATAMATATATTAASVPSMPEQPAQPPTAVHSLPPSHLPTAALPTPPTPPPTATATNAWAPKWKAP